MNSSETAGARGAVLDSRTERNRSYGTPDHPVPDRSRWIPLAGLHFLVDRRMDRTGVACGQDASGTLQHRKRTGASGNPRLLREHPGCLQAPESRPERQRWPTIRSFLLPVGSPSAQRGLSNQNKRTCCGGSGPILTPAGTERASIPIAWDTGPRKSRSRNRLTSTGSSSSDHPTPWATAWTTAPFTRDSWNSG